MSGAHGAGVRAFRARAGAWLPLAALLAIGGEAAGQAGAPARHGILPAVSPDGRHVAFVSERDTTWDLYVIRSDGTDPVRLTRSPAEELTPAWTRDGRIVFTLARGDTTSLHAIGRDGGRSQPLVTIAGRGPVLSHDGRRVAYARGSWTRSRLQVSALDGSGVRPLTDSTAGWFNLAWSPDDRLLAATRRDSLGGLQVWLVNADGSGARALTRFAPGDGRPQWPAWSPDGRQIAIQASSHDRERPERNTSHLWVIEVASGAAARLAPHERPWLDETPAWFPDGRRIAFQSSRAGPLELWVMNADGSGARPLAR